LSSSSSSVEHVEKAGWELLKLESFSSEYGIPSSKELAREFTSTFSGEDVCDKGFRTTSFGGDGIGEVKRKVAAIESDAYEKGFAQGEKDGLEMGIKKNEKVIENISGILKDFVDARGSIVKQYERELLQLIDRIARKVVETTVSINSGTVRETILRALRLAIDSSELTVRVSPDDFDYVKEIKPDFFEKINGLKSITIISDSSISRGGCYVETHFGDIDARLEKQLDTISDAIRKAFEESLSGTSKH
jgi:flagellar assembly protein FliH